MDTKIFDDRVDEARRAYMRAHDAVKAAEADMKVKFALWGEARIAKAEYVGVHVPALPLKYVFSEGDRVVREETQYKSTGYGSFRRSTGQKKTIKQRGVITLCREPDGLRLRNHSPIAGEWFVLSSNGLTGYKLDTSWQPDDAK
jgi:hypothetical protein